MIDLDLLHEVFDHMKGRVRYKLGGKAVNLSEDTSKITAIDCSGFVRFALYRVSNGAMKMPDGSYIQHEWVKQEGWRRLSWYSDLYYTTGDSSRLFIGFIEPSPIGHVFLVNSGVTLESHGGVGVDSRPWDCHVLKTLCNDCYEIPLG